MDVKILDSYRNMAEMIRPHWHLIETAYEAVREAGGNPTSIPVRGGTDGPDFPIWGCLVRILQPADTTAMDEWNMPVPRKWTAV